MWTGNHVLSDLQKQRVIWHLALEKSINSFLRFSSCPGQGGGILCLKNGCEMVCIRLTWEQDNTATKQAWSQESPSGLAGLTPFCYEATVTPLLKVNSQIPVTKTHLCRHIIPQYLQKCIFSRNVNILSRMPEVLTSTTTIINQR